MILAGYLNTIMHAVLDPYFELILDYLQPIKADYVEEISVSSFMR